MLRELGSGLLHRQLYKSIELSGWETQVVAEIHTAAVGALKDRNADMDFHFAVDTPADTPYKPYNPDPNKPAAQIYVQSTAGKIEEISMVSAPVDELKRKYQLTRYYFPERFRNCVDNAVSTKLSS